MISNLAAALVKSGHDFFSAFETVKLITRIYIYYNN